MPTREYAMEKTFTTYAVILAIKQTVFRATYDHFVMLRNVYNRLGDEDENTDSDLSVAMSGREMLAKFCSTQPPGIRMREARESSLRELSMLSANTLPEREEEGGRRNQSTLPRVLVNPGPHSVRD
ncbi:hypothetical protein EYF80_055490 [Liparis tanakae]|uniref:Uncharacterized protein n=1 Tax=Liparis tanakae TaxID=230148 RepID=A0A4Z2F118_9TELE|nr:hypothetical protein EYF80_055490 [Liparis tanakae]